MTNMSADESVPVGVIGLGMMGRPMAVNILNSGAGPVHITGRSRDRYSDLVAAGATVACHSSVTRRRGEGRSC